MGESKSSGNHTAASMTSFAQNLLGNRSARPQDIDLESCVKLRNIEFAMGKLKEMYKMMNVATITKTVKDHRMSMMISSKGKSPTSSVDSGTITGAFKIHTAFAENIKPVTKAGAASPYVIIRVPEGTVVQPAEAGSPKSSNSPKNKEPAPPVILNGSACELLK